MFPRDFIRFFVSLFLLISPTLAHAAVNKGAIKGRVTEVGTGLPVSGVTVTVTGPALQGEMTQFTDDSGQYIVTELPPGEYTVRFYHQAEIIDRPGVVLLADQTLGVSIEVAAVQQTETASQAGARDYGLVIRAPTVDIGSSQLQTSIDETLIRKTPIRGRTYESALLIAPGSMSDDVGTSFNGASSPENVYLLDGMNTTNPGYGVVGSPLSLEFFDEVQVITAGYNAEYGRATGGVVNLVTKSGSNDFHASTWVNYQPLQLRPQRIARLGEAIATSQRRSHQAVDFGADVSGPIIKDRVWFYAGFAPTFVFDRYDRTIRARRADQAPATPDGASYAGDVDSSVGCPSWLTDTDPGLCTGGGFATSDLAGSERTLRSAAKNFSYIAKVDLRLSDDHRATVQYTGSPTRFRGVYNNVFRANSAGNLAGAEFNADPAQMRFREENDAHDVGLLMNSKFLESKLQLETQLTYHREEARVLPDVGDVPQTTDGRLGPITRFEDVAGCEIQTLSNGQTFNPCPVLNYAYGGFGLRYDQTFQRFGASVASTYFANFLGIHGLKLGGDYQASTMVNERSYTGGGFLTVYDDTTVGRFGYASLGEDGQAALSPNGFRGDVTSQVQSVYLRDSYSPDFLPGATINAGVRWEFQQMQNSKGETVLTINDMIAPRVGVVYDWTQRGLSKVYASYGRFFESVPLGLLDRQQSGEYVVNQFGTCMADAAGRIDPTDCTFPDPTAGELIGGFGKIAPKVRGQYSNEFVIGSDLDVGHDIVIGAAFTHRNLGRVIEDISPDGARTFFVGNPGEKPDAGAVRKLQDEITTLNQRIATASEEDREKLTTEKDKKVALLGAYQGAERYPKAKRDYNALVLTARKRFSERLMVLASYTYSRTIGNYEGLYLASTRQLDPNVSVALDLPDFLGNRDGPLPTDRPHNLKLRGAYFLPVGDGAQDGFTFGGSFSAISGAPINVIGGFPFYGRNITLILPRGSAGRTPVVTSLDVHLGYGRNIGGYRLEVVTDLFNVLNTRTALTVDQEYTIDPVLPIVGGKPADLKNLTTTSGTRPSVNSNYGQPTTRQSPFALRFGLRLSF